MNASRLVLETEVNENARRRMKIMKLVEILKSIRAARSSAPPDRSVHGADSVQTSRIMLARNVSMSLNPARNQIRKSSSCFIQNRRKSCYGVVDELQVGLRYGGASANTRNYFARGLRCKWCDAFAQQSPRSLEISARRSRAPAKRPRIADPLNLDKEEMQRPLPSCSADSAWSNGDEGPRRASMPCQNFE